MREPLHLRATSKEVIAKLHKACEQGLEFPYEGDDKMVLELDLRPRDIDRLFNKGAKQ